MRRAVESFLRADDWPYEEVPDSDALVTAVEGRNGTWSCFIHPLEDEHQIVCYARCPVVVPPERRAAAAEYACRANSGLLLGCLEIDLDAGLVSVRTSVDVGDSAVGAGIIGGLLYPNAATMDAYLPGLLMVAGGDVDAAAAIAAVEQGSPD